MYGIRTKQTFLQLLRSRQHYQFSRLSDSPSQYLDNSKKLNEGEPKWMRFFKGHDPIVINLERSLKNEISDTLLTHLKTNYKHFTFSQLILSVEKINKNDVMKILINDINLRIISNDIGDLKLTKVALFKLINTEKLQNSHAFYSLIVFHYGLELFDKMTQEEQTSFLFFMFQNGFTQDNLVQKFVESLQGFNDTSKLNLNQIVQLHCVLQEVKDERASKCLTLLEEQFLINLEDDNLTQEYVEQLFHSRLHQQGAKEALYSVFEKRMDPNLMGLWAITSDQESFLKPLATFLLCQHVPPSERSLLQRLITLFGNAYKDKMDYKVRLSMMKIQQKFQTINKSLAYRLVTEAQVQQSSYEKMHEGPQYTFVFERNMIDILLYFDNIGLETVILRDNLSDNKQAFEIFKLQNLAYFNLYYERISIQSMIKQLNSFPHSEVPSEIVQFQDFVEALDQPQFDEQRQEDNTHFEVALVQKLSQLRMQNHLLGFRENRIQSQSQIFFAPIQRMMRLIDCVYLQLRTYKQSQLSSLKQITLQFFQDQAFQKTFEIYGMVPHMLERLLYIQKSLEFTMPLLNEVQQKMSMIFNQEPQRLVDYLEQQISLDVISFNQKNLFYQEFGEKQELNSKVFNIDDPQNYLLKTVNSPILNNIVQHTELKQIIRDSLPVEWKMNYTIYPAMADFVNIDEKVALFVIDSARLQHGVHDVQDATTRFSAACFQLDGYKVVYVNHQVYSAKRENVLREIYKIIQNFDQS